MPKGVERMNEPSHLDKSRAALIYVTVPNADTGLQIGRTLVERRLAACANVLPQMSSVYWWNDAIQTDNEALLLLKTRQEAVEAAIEAVAQAHPYDVPAITVLPLTAVHPPYLRWLVEETTL